MNRCLVSILLGLVGAASAQASLVITVEPQDQTVLVGDVAVFTVVAQGDVSPLFYQWERDDVAIPGATSDTYTTPPVTAADSGALFSVDVTDGQLTVTSRDAHLTVVEVPEASTLLIWSLLGAIGAGIGWWRRGPQLP